MPLIIGDQPLTLADIRTALDGPITVKLSPAALKAIALSREAIIALIQEGNPIYGVNTGFGKLATTRIAPADLSARGFSPFSNGGTIAPGKPAGAGVQVVRPPSHGR